MNLSQNCAAEIRGYLEAVIPKQLNESDYAAIVGIIATEVAKDKAAIKRSRPPAAPRKRCLLFDSLAVATGYNLAEIGRIAGGRIAIALQDIKSVCPGVTPEEITRRAAAYKRKHQGWDLTPTALASHWSEFSISPEQRTAAARRDPYLEPPDWKSVARRLWGNVNLPESWNELAITLRSDVVRAAR